MTDLYQQMIILHYTAVYSLMIVYQLMTLEPANVQFEQAKDPFKPANDQFELDSDKV